MKIQNTRYGQSLQYMHKQGHAAPSGPAEFTPFATASVFVSATLAALCTCLIFGHLWNSLVFTLNFHNFQAFTIVSSRVVFSHTQKNTNLQLHPIFTDNFWPNCRAGSIACPWRHHVAKRSCRCTLEPFGSSCDCQHVCQTIPWACISLRPMFTKESSACACTVNVASAACSSEPERYYSPPTHPPQPASS